MPDNPELLAAVLAKPANDLPRLVYADWLEEYAGTEACRRCKGTGWDRADHTLIDYGPNWPGYATVGCPACGGQRDAKGSGTASDGRAEWAEFIRVQCRLKTVKHQHRHRDFGGPAEGCKACKLRRAESRFLFSNAAFDSFRTPGLGTPLAKRDGPFEGWLLESAGTAVEVRAEVRRGFVSKVRLPLPLFLGRACGRCGGRAKVAPEWRPGHGGRPEEKCPDCAATPGYVGGVARELFRRHPVERVVPTDCRPQQMNSGHWGWHGSISDDETRSDMHNRESYLPRRLIRRLAGHTHGQVAEGYSAYYDAREAADNALSAAAVALAREWGGLPVLTAAEAARG